ncbi:MAG TPA: YoaK family protein [Planctomycetota bacterium]|nr:YoaK family protein [Planctomycetota bacterium]
MHDSRPRSVLLGGCALTFLCASVNAGYMILLGTSVSHLTGDITRLAIDQVRGIPFLGDAELRLLAATAGFVSGAAAAGFFIHHPKLEFSRPYGRAITGIGLMLLAAHFCFRTHPNLATLLAAAGCGLQNALASFYRGMIVRTTHATGLLTDLGSALGMRLRGHEIELWRVTTPLALVVSLFLGASFGAYMVLREAALFPLSAAFAYLAAGLLWSLLKHVILPRIARRRPPG